MKIALVSPYDFAATGGVVSHIAALADCLARMGQTVRVIAPLSDGVTVPVDGFIPIGRPQPISVNGSVARITLSLNLADTIRRVLLNERFDIVHIHEPFMPMLGTAMLRFSDAVNIGTFHASHWNLFYGAAGGLASGFIRRRAQNLDGRIAVSDVAASYAARYLPGDYRIIPNGVDLTRFTPAGSAIERFKDGKKNILFVGRLEPRKGCIHLLRAFERVRQTLPDVRLIVVGPGELRPDLEKWTHRHRMENDIIFTGYVPNDSLPAYYRSAEIFCSPATGRESFGIVLLEAMAAGRPVVASNIDGYAGVVTDGAEGVLFPAGNEAALAGTLIRLLTSPAECREMGRRGLTTAGKYRWQDVARRVLDYYYETLERVGEKKGRPVSKPENAGIPV